MVYRIPGRKKELIRYKGYTIAPSMLDNELYEHPDIKHCMVIGKKDPIVGELLISFCVVKTEC